MAFRTNKVPAVEERTVSGSSVSFNSAFALPLKACKVSFSATQASGTPSPSTPLPISGVSSIGLTANSTPVSVSLGEEQFGGELDLLTGELTVTHGIIELDGSELWSTRSTSNGFFKPISDMKTNQNSGMSNWLPYNNSYDIFGFCLRNGSLYANQITNNIEGITNSTEWRAYLSNHPLTAVYELAEPITIQLSANELSTILGNNTFSTDAGTLEITFADLQEKSASGSVAAFNTALAMPLPSCNIAVNAWQEGSGDPYPAGGSAQKWDEEWEQGTISTTNGVPIPSTSQIRSKNYTPCVPNQTYYLSTDSQNFRIFYYDTNKDFISVDGYWYNRTFVTPVNAYYLKISSGSAYGGTYKNDVSINYPATDTAYHPYFNIRPIHGWDKVNIVNSPIVPVNKLIPITVTQEGTGEPSPDNIRPIHAGLTITRDDDTTLDVYGGTLDVVSGELAVTYDKFVIDETKNIGLPGGHATGYSCYRLTKGFNGIPSNCKDLSAIICSDRFETEYSTAYTKAKNYITSYSSGVTQWIISIANEYADAEEQTTTENFKAWLEDNNITVIYEMTTPTVIQLSATELQRAKQALGINTYTIQLGDTYYGGYYDSVNGVFVATHRYIDFNIAEFITYSSGTLGIYYCSTGGGAVGYNGNNLCSCFKKSSVNNIGNMDDLSYVIREGAIYLRNSNYANDLSGFTDSVKNNSMIIELSTPITIPLTPTEIKTLNGANNIFCDTGNTSVVFKDLDLARRGNFREVFKLPS